MFRHFVIAVTVILVVSLSRCAYAQTVDLHVNDDTAEIQFRSVISEQVYGYMEFNARFLYSSEKHADNKLGSAGVDAYGELEAVPGLEMGVGTKLYGGRVDHEGVLGVGLGGLLRYAPPALNGFVFSGTLYYVPKVSSFLDLERLLESGLRLGYQIIPNAAVYVGYRNIQTHIKHDGRSRVAEGFYGGLEFRF